MTFDQIGVSIGDMQGVSSQFAARANELEQLLSQVQGQIQALGGTWRGQASAEFANLMAEWTKDVQGIQAVLATVSQHLNQAATAYQETDQGVARGFRLS